MRGLKAKEWEKADLVWRGSGCDAALLKVKGEGVPGAACVKFGKLADGSVEPVPCRSVGFPIIQADKKQNTGLGAT